MTPITALTDPNQLPNQLQDQQTFDANMASMIDMFPERARQENGLAAEMMALVSQVGVIAAGGAYAIPYIFDTSTVDGDPGPGKLRLSHIPHDASTFMRLDPTSGGQDYTTLIDTFDDSTSTVKGSIRLVKQGDITKWMTFNLTALATPSGYRNLTVVCTDSSAPSPFSNGDPLMLSFQRTGDKGQDSVGALQLLGVATVGAAVAQIDFLNIFSSTYDRYVIELQHVVPSANQQLWMRLANAGVLVSTGYSDLTSSDSAMSAANQLRLTTETTAYATLTVHVRNVAGSNPTSVGAYGSWYSVVGSGLRPRQAEGVSSSGSAPSGFRLFWSGGANFTAGTVRVYGAKNS
jgi:hypothetical protein